MNFLLLPLSRQSDAGFGIMGDSFRTAAANLVKLESTQSGNFTHLPTNFLYRHANELFLESMIFLVYRAVGGLSLKTAVAELPQLRCGKKQMRLDKTHDISALFRKYESLVKENAEKLSKLARTDWSNIPSEIYPLISTINKFDSGSFFSRYPDFHNQEANDLKSSNIELSEIDVSNMLGPEFHTHVVNDSDVLFSMIDDPLPEFSKALIEACDLLYGAHIGLRYELYGGH